VTVSSHLDHAGLEIWWAALGAGLVVIACVVILLSLLTAFVRDIKRYLLAATRHADSISEHLRAVSLIGESAGLIHDLGDELELQVAVVARSSGGA
jgi:isochorismate hydrolase